MATFRDSVSVPSSRVKMTKKIALFLDVLTLKDGTDTLSRNVANPTPRNSPRAQVHRRGNLKSRIFLSVVVVVVVVVVVDGGDDDDDDDDVVLR